MRTLFKLFGLGAALALVVLAEENSGPAGAAQSCTITLSPGDSIQQAIDNASSGAVICLQAGTWNENINIGKSLTLKGASRDQTTLKSARESTPVVHVSSTSPIEVTLEGLTLTRASGGCPVRPDRCAIGLVMRGQVRVTIKNSQISDNRDVGLWVTDFAQATVQNSQISNNRYAGLAVTGFAQATVQNSQISNNENYGLGVGDSAQVTVQNSQISNNEDVGLGMGDSTQVTVQNSQISNNGYGGLAVWGSAARVTVQNSQISNNGYDGFFVWSSAQVTVQNSQIFDNESSGLEVWGANQVTMEGSLIEGNGTDERCRRADWICNGIVVKGTRHMELSDTTIRNNTHWGIAAWLRKCGFNEDDFQGTVLWQNRGNRIYDNGQGDVCLP